MHHWKHNHFQYRLSWKSLGTNNPVKNPQDCYIAFAIFTTIKLRYSIAHHFTYEKTYILSFYFCECKCIKNFNHSNAMLGTLQISLFLSENKLIWFFNMIRSETEIIMANKDTVCLLRECNSGTQMAVYSIDDILENVKDVKLKEILASSKKEHEQLGNELHVLLLECGDNTKDPGPIAKGMSRMKTNAKLMMDDSDKACADLITDGCNMGIKSLQHYINEYSQADLKVKEKANKLIQIEESLRDELQDYL